MNDPFVYDVSNPTSPLPNRVYSGAAAYHANLTEGVPAILSYTSTMTTTTSGESVVVVDLYGRENLGCCNDRDDNIDVQLFNGSYASPIATVTGLSIDNTADGWTRAIFDSLPVGTSFDRIRVIGNDSGGGASNNYLTLLETRAATTAIPEPSSTALLALCGGLLLRRKRRCSFPSDRASSGTCHTATGIRHAPGFVVR